MRKILFFLAVFLLTACVSNNDLYEKGCRAMLAGRYDEALKLFNEIDIDTLSQSDLAGRVAADMANCYLKKGDSTAYVSNLRRAALLGNRDATTSLITYIESHHENISDYVGFYTALHNAVPSYGLYAARLAKVYLFDNKMKDYNKAATLLMPFVSRTGTKKDYPQVSEKAFAAYMLANGLGGYAESPEAAMYLVEECIKTFNSYKDDEEYKMDADAIAILGDLELLRENRHYDNPDNAKKCYQYAIGHTMFTDTSLLNAKINCISDFISKRERVLIDPMWWDRKPDSWTSYVNNSGFSYIGHTSDSGTPKDKMQLSGYPTGPGYGCWTKQFTAFIGNWSNGNPTKGLFISTDGTSFN